MLKRLKRLIVLLLVVAAGGAAYWYFSLPPTSLVLTGIVTTNDVVVGPQIGGRLDQLLVSEGDGVKRGQLLATIAPGELQAESSFASANVAGVTSQIREAEAAL